MLCISIPDDSNTGVFGGHSSCSNAPISNDRSSLSTRTYSLEGLVTTSFDGPLNFLVGATYVDNKISENHYTLNSFGLDYAGAMLGALTSLGRTLTGTATPPSYLGPTMFDSYTPDFRLKSYGIFGEAYFEPSDKFKLTLGVRYNNDKKSLRARNQLLNFLVPYGTTNAYASPSAAGYDADAVTACPTPGSAVAGNYGSVAGCDAFQLRDATFSAMTGRAVLDYKLSEENLLYASYSRGYKSGGIKTPLAVALGGLQTLSNRNLSTPSKSEARTSLAMVRSRSTHQLSTISIKGCSCRASSTAPRSTTMSMPTSTVSRQKLSSARPAG